MRTVLIAAVAACALSTTALGQGLMRTAPATSTTVTNYYKQSVYDQGDNKIGEIMDVLIGQNGRVNGLVIGVGGFLGMGEKDVLVSFDAVKNKMKDNKWYLTMNTTKEALKAAPGFKYDSTKTMWMPDASKAADKK